MFILSETVMLKALPQDAVLPDLRIVEILERIRTTFITKGFDGASMQELARSAGMSAGNFYRYFPSKTAIIGALISRDLTKVMEEFAVVNRARDPLAALRLSVAIRVGMPAPAEDARLWAEIEAVASRDSSLGTICHRMHAAIHDEVTATFARIGGCGEPFIRRHHQHSVDALMILVKGAAIRAGRPAETTDAAAMNALVMRMFDTILADITALADMPDATRCKSLT